MGGQVQSTMIGLMPGLAKEAQPSYVKRYTETAVEKKSRETRDEIREMAERLSLDQSVIVSILRRHRRLRH